VITILKELIRRLGRRRWFRAPALVVVRAFNAVTFHLLERRGDVVSVFVKGSYVRGPFYPLASDLDLVLVLRGAAFANPVEDFGRLFRSLRRARALNPSLRDWWHHLIVDHELPLVRRYWYLFGCDEWRDRSGTAPQLDGGPADRRLLVLAHWYQQCAWSASAVQAFVAPDTPFHHFGAGIRKASLLGSRLRALCEWRDDERTAADLFELRRAHAAAWAEIQPTKARSEREKLAALTGLFRDLEESARRVRTLEPEAVAHRPPAGAPSAGALPDGLEPLAEVSELDGVVRCERSLHLLLRDGASDAAIARGLTALRRLGPHGRILTLLVPAAAAPLWPMACTLSREVYRVGGPYADARGPETVALGPQRRLLLFESIFLPNLLRLTLSFPDRDQRLRRAYWQLARAVALYDQGRYCRTWSELAALGFDPPSSGPGRFDPGAWFEAGSLLVDRLREALARPDAVCDSTRPVAEANRA